MVKKKVEDNESETVVLQRRALRTSKALKAGAKLDRSNVIPLRPCPIDGLEPKMIEGIVDRTLINDLEKGALIKLENTIKK